MIIDPPSKDGVSREELRAVELRLTRQVQELQRALRAVASIVEELTPEKKDYSVKEKHQKEEQATFQQRVESWMMACFGPEISADKIERNHRFLEESLELVQACGCTADEAHQLVDYVYGRPVGEPSQEAGGVMLTLAALCLAQELDMHEAGETELARVWAKMDVIRAKQAAKPKHSPLAAHPVSAPAVAETQPCQHAFTYPGVYGDDAYCIRCGAKPGEKG